MNAKTSKPKLALNFDGGVPLALERPLTLFRSLKPSRVSLLTFSPDTALRVVNGHGFKEFFRKEKPDFLYVATRLVDNERKNRPHTQRLKEEALKVFDELTPGSTTRLEQLFLGPGMASTSDVLHWKEFVDGLEMGRAGAPETILSAIAKTFARFDEVSRARDAAIRTNSPAAGNSLLHEFLSETLPAWRAPVTLTFQDAYLPTQAALHVLARILIVEAAQVTKSGKSERVPPMSSYLSEGFRPIGHWLRETCGLFKCSNFAEMDRMLLAQRANYLDVPLDQSRIRKWSSSHEVVMPAAAMTVLTEALQAATGINADAVDHRFRVARTLTFLCDLLYATSPSEISWEQAQAQIKLRLEHAHTFEQAAIAGGRELLL